jgi:hypothetical protein
MTSPKAKRKRGVILTTKGYQKLWQARLESELQSNDGESYTYEEISEKTRLDNGTIKRILGRKEGVDKRSIERFFKGFDLTLEDTDYTNPCPDPILADSICKRKDLQPKVDASTLCGRTEELSDLRQCILQDRCRLVALLGMGGIGKTALAAKLVDQIGNGFEYVLWRSLRDALPIETFLTDFIQLIADDQNIAIDLSNKSLACLLRIFSRYIQKNRCLLVLDNFETILHGGKRVGDYCEGCEDYGRLLQLAGEIEHASCLIITSREKPREVACLEGADLAVRSLQLKGLESQSGQKLLCLKKLSGSEQEYQKLINLYTGNPLALKISATTIKDLFDGDIAEFLKQEAAIFGDIRDLLDQQFERLTDVEQCLMYWLAINREPVSLRDLQEDIAVTTSIHSLLESLESLARRSLIEKEAKLFTLQPVVMEYVTACFIERVCHEVFNKGLNLFYSHALIKPTGKNYIQDVQRRIFLEPVCENLCEALESRDNAKNHLFSIIEDLRQRESTEVRYAAGNAINLLCQLGTDLTGCNLTNLTIWHADLRCICLHNVNFSGCHFEKSVFAETFGGVFSVAISPDSSFLATGDTNGLICLREIQLAEAQVWRIKGHSGWVTAIEFSPDGKILASASTDYEIKLWSTETGKWLKTFKKHKNEVWSISFSPDGQTLASGSDDYSIKLWSLESGDCIASLMQSSGYVTTIAFNPGGQVLASGSSDYKIRLWNLKSKQCFAILQGHEGLVRSVAYSPDGNRLASGSEDNTIKLWDMSASAVTWYLRLS